MTFRSAYLRIGTHYRDHYRLLVSQPRFWLRLAGGFAFFVFSLVVLHATNAYTRLGGSVPAPDILLDYLPRLPLDDIYLEGFALLLGFILLLGLHKPHKLPFLLKTIALFTCIRAFFTILTHLSLPLSQVDYNRLYAPQGGIFQLFSSGNDLFFSGHTGLPFLMALMFWKHLRLRLLFLFLSVFFGAAVLLAHVHYSIDVFGAFFITYSIYHLASWLFKRDAEYFLAEPTTRVPSLKIQ